MSNCCPALVTGIGSSDNYKNEPTIRTPDICYKIHCFHIAWEALACL